MTRQRGAAIILWTLALCCWPLRHAPADENPTEIETIDFDAFESPIILRGGTKWAYRDPAVVYHEGTFYLYYTLSEMADDGGYYNMTALSKSRDLVHWSKPRVLTPRDRKLNYSSPGNVIRYEGKWVICLQTYPTPNLERWGNATSRIWIQRSDDLESWSPPELLRVKGPDVAVEDMGRMIDPYLIEDADEPGKWWCFYKQNGVSMSWSRDLKTWHYVGRRAAGENVTILRHEGKYVMFHSPSNGIGVKASQRLDDWGKDVQLLRLGQERWPWARSRLTAATVVDLTKQPEVGKFIMFFHGADRSSGKVAPAHSAASMAIAWSDDLEQWSWPGKGANDKKSTERGRGVGCTLRVETDPCTAWGSNAAPRYFSKPVRGLPPRSSTSSPKCCCSRDSSAVSRSRSSFDAGSSHRLCSS